MEQVIKDILADLYRLDPGLRDREAELVKLIGRLLAARPDTNFDEKFRAELRERLLAEFAARPGRSKSLWDRLTDAFAVRRLGFALGGAVLAALLLAVWVMRPGTGPIGIPDGSPGLDAGRQTLNIAFGPQISAGAEKAFGSLAGDGTAAAGSGRSAVSTGAPSASPAPLLAQEQAPLGLGGGGKIAAADAGMEAGSMIYEPPIRYDFKYEGELPELGASVEVLKRDTSFNTAALAGVFAGLDLGLMDLARLRDLSVQNVSLAENREYGYLVNLNFEDGSINIWQNWNRWPQPQWDCAPETGCVPPRLKLEDMPADDAAIGIAAAFLSDMGISTAGLAEPSVDNSWRRWYEAAEDKAGYWFPDQMTVVYPQLINGRRVYNSDGRVVGLMVTVDVRSRKVYGISPIYSQRYVGSGYEAETDAAKIVEKAAQGGIIQMYYGSGEQKVVEVGLGAPELAYYNHWIYRNGRSENLLVPALVFPLTNAPSDQGLYLEKVVVPLAKEILGQEQGGGPFPILLRGETPAAAVEPAMVPELPEPAPR